MTTNPNQLADELEAAFADWYRLVTTGGSVSEGAALEEKVFRLVRNNGPAIIAALRELEKQK